MRNIPVYVYNNYYSHNKVDRGAIRFILSGANIMCPGLTSKGAKMETSLPPNTVVVSSLYIPFEVTTH